MAANPSLIERLLRAQGALVLGLRDRRGSKILTQRTQRKSLEFQRCPLKPSLPCHFAFGGGHGTNGIHFEEAKVVPSGRLLTAPDKRQDYGEDQLQPSRVGRCRGSHQP